MDDGDRLGELERDLHNMRGRAEAAEVMLDVLRRERDAALRELEVGQQDVPRMGAWSGVPRVHEAEPPGPELEALRRELAAFVVQTGRRPPLAVAGQVADELYLVQGDDVYRVKGEWVPPQRQGEWPPRDAAGDEVPLPAGAVPMPRLRRLPGSGSWGMACACDETFYTVGDYELHWRDEHGEVTR